MRQLKRVKVVWLKAREQARKTFNELQQLGESLKVRQLQPVWCDVEGFLIVGERRWRAAKLVGLDELDAMVTDEKLTPAEIQAIQLTENLHRADLTQCEKWQALVEFQKVNPGVQQKELAATLKIDPSMVTRLLSPGKCITRAQELFAAGKLGITDCYALSRATEQEQHEMLDAKLNGSSRDELERTVRRKRNGTPSVKVSRVSIPLTGVTVTVAGESVGFDEMLDACAEVVKRGRKAQGQKHSLATFAKAMADEAKGAKSCSS
jgi:ParB family transcriptional regulator, chromosome partitioning protein